MLQKIGGTVVHADPAVVRGQRGSSLPAGKRVIGAASRSMEITLPLDQRRVIRGDLQALPDHLCGLHVVVRV
jgi:hypothetical protein